MSMFQLTGREIRWSRRVHNRELHIPAVKVRIMYNTRAARRRRGGVLPGPWGCGQALAGGRRGVEREGLSRQTPEPIANVFITPGNRTGS